MLMMVLLLYFIDTLLTQDCFVFMSFVLFTFAHPEVVVGMETWVLVLAVAIPSTTCLILIIASVLFLCLQKRYKSQKNGYPITPGNLGLHAFIFCLSLCLFVSCLLSCLCALFVSCLLSCLAILFL